MVLILLDDYFHDPFHDLEFVLRQRRIHLVLGDLLVHSPAGVETRVGVGDVVVASRGHDVQQLTLPPLDGADRHVECLFADEGGGDNRVDLTDTPLAVLGLADRSVGPVITLSTAGSGDNFITGHLSYFAFPI